MVNKLGQTRLAQYFTDISNNERKTLESELVRKCLGRDDSKCSIVVHRNYKIVYRRYVSLYFIVGIDLEEEVFIFISRFIFMKLLLGYISSWE